ncbi:hypothetical protein QR685DRAFT_152317 [Neurospora intermedia]|uniref:Transmembrane protein n=1 Tax=Neurospora intermedia TaxID=5142 RepID=A0ABR3DJ73_NEUIN
MEILAILKSRESDLLSRLTQSFSRSVHTATASLSLFTKHNANQTPSFDLAATTITPRSHQLFPRDSVPLSSTALLGAVLGSICGVIFFVICCFFYIRFRAWSDATMTARSRQKRWRRAHYYHDSFSSSSTSDSSTSASSRPIPRDVEMGEAGWPGAGVAGGAQRGYGYGQRNVYGQAQTQAQMSYGVGFEGGATGGNVGFGTVTTGYGPDVAQAPRVPPVATTKWSPHVFRQGNM